MNLRANLRFSGEWDIAVVGPHFAACLVARDLGDCGPDCDARFEFILSHQRNLAIDVAVALMRRLADTKPQLPMPTSTAAMRIAKNY